MEGRPLKNFGLGFIVGPLLGGLFGEIGPRIPFYVAAGLAFINFLFGYFVLPESLSLENRRAFNWKRANPIGTIKQLFGYIVFVTRQVVHKQGHVSFEEAFYIESTGKTAAELNQGIRQH